MAVKPLQQNGVTEAQRSANVTSKSVKLTPVQVSDNAVKATLSPSAQRVRDIERLATPESAKSLALKTAEKIRDDATTDQALTAHTISGDIDPIILQ